VKKRKNARVRELKRPRRATLRLGRVSEGALPMGTSGKKGRLTGVTQSLSRGGGLIDCAV